MNPAERAALGDALLASAGDAIVLCGADGAIRFWNPGAERIFGIAAADALGKSLDIIIPEPQRARHWQGFDRVMATGQSRYGAGETLSVPALHASGRRISVEFTIMPLHDDQGAITGLASILRDVTPRFEELRTLRRQLAGKEKRKPGGTSP